MTASPSEFVHALLSARSQAEASKVSGISKPLGLEAGLSSIEPIPENRIQYPGQGVSHFRVRHKGVGSAVLDINLQSSHPQQSSLEIAPEPSLDNVCGSDIQSLGPAIHDKL